MWCWSLLARDTGKCSETRFMTEINHLPFSLIRKYLCFRSYGNKALLLSSLSLMVLKAKSILVLMLCVLWHSCTSFSASTVGLCCSLQANILSNGNIKIIPSLFDNRTICLIDYYSITQRKNISFENVNPKTKDDLGIMKGSMKKVWSK